MLCGCGYDWYLHRGYRGDIHRINLTRLARGRVVLTLPGLEGSSVLRRGGGLRVGYTSQTISRLTEGR